MTNLFPLEVIKIRSYENRGFPQKEFEIVCPILPHQLRKTYWFLVVTILFFHWLDLFGYHSACLEILEKSKLSQITPLKY